MTTKSDKVVLATVNPTFSHADTEGRALLRQVLKSYLDDVELGDMPAIMAYQRLQISVNSVLEAFRQKHAMTGTRYWYHPESESYFSTGPHETISEYQASVCDEYDRQEWLNRQDDEI